MVCAFITVVMLLGVIMILFVFACHKVGKHVAQNPEAGKQIVEHVVIPLLKKEEEAPPMQIEAKVEEEPKRIKGRMM